MDKKQDNLSGLLIRGYRIHEILGEGAYATVYRAERQSLGTSVALKAIQLDMISDPVFMKRFEHEARLISRLHHPHIPLLFDYWRDEYGAYIVIEFYEGGSLRTRLAKAPLSLDEALQTLDAIASALDYAHRNQVVHRDVKPSNILFDANGEAYLADFGIAKDSQLASDNLTETGSIVGTAKYASPEQLRSQTVTYQSDIFSLGMTLYEMLTGEYPFSKSTHTNYIAHLLEDAVPDLQVAGIPTAANDVIQRATAKHPADRYDSALDMAASFREAVNANALQIEDLTPKELEVLQHFADGLSIAEIGEAMFVEPSTVKFHRRNLYAKLGVEKRAQAIIIAHQHNLIFRDIDPEPTPDPAAAMLRTHLKRHNLPPETGDFIGRKDEIAQIVDLLNDPHNRLLTILAPGGMGKSVLAIEVARQQFEAYRDGVYFVELAPLEDAQQIPDAIAEALGYRFADGDHIQQIIEYLEYKNLLLVLDNFEHLLDGKRHVSQIIAKAREVQIIVTSRERLNLRSEILYSLFGLGFPITKDETKDNEAPSLLVQEMQRKQPDFELSDENLPHIVRVCQLVEGMPLALVLAAAWGDVLSIAEIADEIERSLDFLAADLSDMPRRHWDMRALLQTTWERLSADEQTAFMKMSIFHGGCTREAAEAVTDINLRTLTNLVHKAMLQSDTASGRFKIHELLRQYAWEKLGQNGQTEAIRDVHMRYYADFMQTLYPHMLDQRLKDALDTIEADFENVRAAWYRAIQQVEETVLDKICRCLGQFLIDTDQSEQMAILFNATAILEGRIREQIWGRLLRYQGAANTQLSNNDNPRGRQQLEAALAIARRYDDKADIAFTLDTLALSYAMPYGNSEFALKLAEEAYILFEEIGLISGLGQAKFVAGFIYSRTGGAYQEAYRHHEQALALWTQTSVPRGMATVLHNMGYYQICLGNLALARQHTEAALKLHLQHQFLDPTGTYGNLMWLAIYFGQLDQAREYVEKAYEAAERMGTRSAFIEALKTRMEWQVLQSHFDDALITAAELTALRQDNSHEKYVWVIDQGIGVALCGLERYHEATPYIDRALVYGIERVPIGNLPLLLIGKIAVLAHQAQEERGLELLALTFALPHTLIWRERHPLVLRVRDELKSHFEPAEYEVIWQRGAAQAENVREVIQALVDEIGLK